MGKYPLSLVAGIFGGIPTPGHFRLPQIRKNLVVWVSPEQTSSFPLGVFCLPTRRRYNSEVETLSVGFLQRHYEEFFPRVFGPPCCHKQRRETPGARLSL
ncbi:hypothetical protein TNIN_300361 [Trichonephila inaurata madagascariensis]|uniref:Uncharacterized protein n=1 Tax=Trichonephila inaurata madagascariensis TaxID=2747483 RepID=A0A8X6YDW2_9ARAC|nr:hypothetical protein TNIN_300361 [Trichonephila inaurata madagascariensis]